MDRSVPFLNACVSFVVFVTTLTLVVYMLVAFVTGVFDLAQLMFETVFLEAGERQAVLNGLNSEFLHNIAILLILIKTYRILIEFMRYRHIEIKFMVEITIVACVLELLFNFTAYTIEMRYVLMALAIGFLGLYVFKYDTLLKAKKDSQKEAIALVKKGG